jgi:hypothetical protein
MICETARRARQRQEVEREQLRRQQETQQKCVGDLLHRAALTMPPCVQADNACTAAS